MNGHAAPNNHSWVRTGICRPWMACCALVLGLACQGLASAGPKTSSGSGQAAPTQQPTPALPAPTPAPTPAPPHPLKPSERERILNIAASLVGNTETHGNNRSPLIDQMNRLTGVPMGSPYCASFNSWCYNQAGIDRTRWPLTAWSPSWVARPTWTRAKGGKEPLPADAFGLYWEGRTRHTGLIKEWGAGKSARTVEANTAPTAESGDQANGDGIWIKRRLKSQIDSVRDWLD